ncbi:hypothetical protein GALMADRAFT_1086266 [Galerina marginata CBS 339.88]|uniref:Uncharacterized protein n=1 Tax=Galerina marginata (strain CBS 339.88) TaxID=685588 RepID=A0A067SI83_GALM3|nr:hypothetical protein GALMADRAFT_1086266 [Galerina marginata CBS 339.88]
MPPVLLDFNPQLTSTPNLLRLSLLSSPLLRCPYPRLARCETAGFPPQLPPPPPYHSAGLPVPVVPQAALIPLHRSCTERHLSVRQRKDAVEFQRIRVSYRLLYPLVSGEES